jgi:hypothetical protein
MRPVDPNGLVFVPPVILGMAILTALVFAEVGGRRRARVELRARRERDLEST